MGKSPSWMPRRLCSNTALAVVAYGAWLAYLGFWFCYPQTGIKQSFGRSKTKHKVPPEAKQAILIEAAISAVSIIVVLGVVGGGIVGVGQGIKGELGRGSMLYVHDRMGGEHWLMFASRLIGALVSGAVSLALTLTIGTRVRSVVGTSENKA